MSDTESQATLEDIAFPKILEILDSAAQEAISTSDPLSYSTVLDIYLGQPSRYAYPEREQLLERLLAILEKNDELVSEIGWDLPGLLIQYIDSDFDFVEGIRSAPCVYKVLKLFEVLAKNGNHKELLLKACEVLSSIRIEDSEIVTSSLLIQEKFFDLKVYCLLELISSCLRNVKTLYPSRFLSMALTAFINLLFNNMAKSAINVRFVVKRAYSFVKNYVPPQPPTDLTADELKGLDLAKIAEDERKTSRKLLTAFVSSAIEMVYRQYVAGYSLELVSVMQKPFRNQIPKYFDFSVSNDAVSRMLLLVQSYDIDLKDNFKNYLVDSHKLFHSFKYGQESEDALSGKIFEAVLVDYQNNVYSSLINTAKQIADSQLGYLLLYAHYVNEDHRWNDIELNLNDVIVYTLRSTIPGMVKRTFVNRGIHDTSLFWSWFVIQNAKSSKQLEVELQKSVPPVLLKLYFQALLFICITSETNANIRYLLLSLLTKLLSLSPEPVTYEFLKDSLENCPYQNVRVALVGILKELISKDKAAVNHTVPVAATKAEAPPKQAEASKGEKEVEAKESTKKTDDKPETTADDLVKGLNGVNLNAPPLPPRAEPSEAASKYITLTKERADEILAITSDTYLSTFRVNKDSVDVDISRLSTLSALLNLWVVVKTDPNVDQQKLSAIIDSLVQCIEKVKLIEKEDVNKVNAVDILSIAIERIKTK